MDLLYVPKSSQVFDHSSIVGYLDCQKLARNISEEKNFSMLPRDCSCDILVKYVAAFFSSLKNLPKVKVKRFTLIPLAEEISKQPSIVSVVWLLVTLMKIYN